MSFRKVELGVWEKQWATCHYLPLRDMWRFWNWRDGSQFKTSIALNEDRSWLPSTQVGWLTTSRNSILKGIQCLWPLLAPGLSCTCLPHLKNKTNLLKERDTWPLGRISVRVGSRLGAGWSKDSYRWCCLLIISTFHWNVCSSLTYLSDYMKLLLISKQRPGQMLCPFYLDWYCSAQDAKGTIFSHWPDLDSFILAKSSSGFFFP